MSVDFSKIKNWLQTHPLQAFMLLLAYVCVLLFSVLVVQLIKSKWETNKYAAVEQEQNLCTRLKKLEALEPKVNKRAANAHYQRVLSALIQELIHTSPMMDDVDAMARFSPRCDSLSLVDFAWLFHIEAHLPKGIWPIYPQLPPLDTEIREKLVRTLEEHPYINIKLSRDSKILEQWLLLFSISEKLPLSILEGSTKDPQDAIYIYQRLALLNPKSSLLAALYKKLNLLERPLYIKDKKQLVFQASMVAPQLKEGTLSPPIGPDKTLLYLGALGAQQCAIAASSATYPPLWLRPCQDILLRRLSVGELFLLSFDVSDNQSKSLHWSPILIDNQGDIKTLPQIYKEVSQDAVRTFIKLAPHYALGKKGYGIYTKELIESQARIGIPKKNAEDNTQQPSYLSFSTEYEPGAPNAISFSPTPMLHLEFKDCPKIQKDRCETLIQGNNYLSCDIIQSFCVVLNTLDKIRVSSVQLGIKEECEKEYGSQNQCATTKIPALFIDTQKAGQSDYHLGDLIRVQP